MFPELILLILKNIFAEIDNFIVPLNSATVHVPYNVRSDDHIEIEHNWINIFRYLTYV